MEYWSNLRLSSTCQIPFLQHYFKKYLPAHSGTFVEVGAFDGESFSNSSGLADLGWNGIYIEPHPEFAKLCKRRHPQEGVTVVQCAISDTETELILDVGGALTTASRDTRDAFSNIHWAKGVNFKERIKVPSVTLDALLKRLNVPRGFDLLVVDVEGLEGKVFASFNLGWWRPKMLIVELNDYHKSFLDQPVLQSASMRLRHLIQATDYMQVYADAINTIFVSKTECRES